MRYLAILALALLLVLPADTQDVLPVRRKQAVAAAAGGGAIAFDAVSNNTPLTGSSSTHAHTCTGANRALLVIISSVGTATITGVTYNAVAMTELWDLDTSDFVECRSAGYILIAPATGANNVVVTLSASADFVCVSATSWTGVNQTGGVGNSWRTPVDSTGLGTADPAALTVANAQNGDVVVNGIAAWNSALVLSPNQTLRFQDDPIDTSAFSHGHQSHAATGSTLVQWTNSDNNWSAGAVALIPQ